MRREARGATLAAALALPAAFAWTGVAVAIEEPRFERLSIHAVYELRRYAPTLVAETEVQGVEFGAAANEGFRRLAGYIFGGNTTRGKIAMTAPVAQRPAGQKIAMTAPVGQRAAESGYVVSFTMPAGYTLATLPVPDDPRVRLRAVPAHCAAVHAYSGTWNEQRYAELLAELRAAAREAGLAEQGEATLARFDPPWKPWFLRRNEIQLPVRCPGA